MPPPSVKGTIFRTVVNELCGHLSQGLIEREDLAAHCKPHDLEYLDREIAIASWYPVDTYGRYLRFLCHRFGGGRREYLMRGGLESARHVVEMGVYGQLDERTQEHWEERIGRVLVTLGGSFYNFGKWVWKGIDEKGFRIEVQDAAAMPEEAAARAHGFVQYLARRAAGRDVRIDYHRPTASLIVFSCPDLLR